MPCGSEIGLELYKSLSHSTHFKLVGGSSVDDHGRFVYENYIGGLPFVDDPKFIEKINIIIDAHNIQFVFPAHDSVVLKLAQAAAHNQLHCEVITSPVQTCTLARSKLQTYRFFAETVFVPKLYEKIDELYEAEFPIFMKPDVGQGSKGTYLVRNKADAIFHLNKDPSLLSLEYLPGKEYTIDCFTDRHGELRLAEGRERRRIQNGISVNSASVQDERFQQMAIAINQKTVFRGVWFFQVKENRNSDLVLMEIAPRVAGTMGLIRCRGVNLPLLSLYDAMNYDIDVLINKYEIVIDRSLQNTYQHNLQYKHVYLDFDDLVVFNNMVNTSIIAFVYQCINKNINVHLITKHKYDIHETLKKYKLTDIFDTVIHLAPTDKKCQYIKHSDAIFIDDSFAERKHVFDTCHIPVFDADNIEALMEKY
jgi:hypothetical protein